MIPISHIAQMAGFLSSMLLMVSLPAYAEDVSESLGQQSNKAKKIMRVLDSLGLNDENVLAVVEYIDARSKNKYVAFADETFIGGNLKVGYSLEDGFHPGNPEIRYSLDEYNTAIVAQRRGVMANYKLKF